MFPVPEQFSAATKAQFEAQLKIINALTSQAFDSAERVIALNIGATKAALEKSSAAAHQLFSAQGAGKFLTPGAAQPDLAAMMAYGRQLLGIAAPATPAAAAPKPLALEAAKQVEAVQPVAVAKPVEAVKPVKPVKPVIVAKQVEAVKPVIVAKPVEAVKPVAKPVAVVTPAAIAKPAAVAKPVAVATPAAIAKPVATPVAAAKPVAAAPVPKKGVAPFPKSPVGK
jgi:phasin family protein